jgi:hypothetical protein
MSNSDSFNSGVATQSATDDRETWHNASSSSDDTLIRHDNAPSSLLSETNMQRTLEENSAKPDPYEPDFTMIDECGKSIIITMTMVSLLTMVVAIWNNFPGMDAELKSAIITLASLELTFTILLFVCKRLNRYELYCIEGILGIGVIAVIIWYQVVFFKYAFTFPTRFTSDAESILRTMVVVQVLIYFTLEAFALFICVCAMVCLCIEL